MRDSNIQHSALSTDGTPPLTLKLEVERLSVQIPLAPVPLEAEPTVEELKAQLEQQPGGMHIEHMAPVGGDATQGAMNGLFLNFRRQTVHK